MYKYLQKKGAIIELVRRKKRRHKEAKKDFIGAGPHNQTFTDWSYTGDRSVQ